MPATPQSRRRAWIVAAVFGWATAAMLLIAVGIDISDDDPLSATVEGLATITFAIGWVAINRLVDHSTFLKRALRAKTVAAVPTQDPGAKAS